MLGTSQPKDDKKQESAHFMSLELRVLEIVELLRFGAKTLK